MIKHLPHLLFITSPLIDSRNLTISSPWQRNILKSIILQQKIAQLQSKGNYERTVPDNNLRDKTKKWIRKRHCIKVNMHTDNKGTLWPIGPDENDYVKQGLKEDFKNQLI